MNKKELRSLIKESFVELIKEGLLTEKFASKNIATISKKLRGRDKDVFQMLHNAHGIAWDQVTDDFAKKGADTSKGINFFFINKTAKNPYSKNSWDDTIHGPNLIGVTIGKKVVYTSRESFSTTKRSGYRSGNSQMGVNAKEMNNFKRFNELADEVWNVDYKGAAKDFSTSGKTADRSAAKQGATALVAASKVAAENRTRYEKALRDRLANTGPGDQVVKMVSKINQEYKKSLDVKVAMLKKGKVGQGWGGYLGTVSSAYDDIMRDFEYFMREEKAMAIGKKKDMEKGGEGEWSEEKYYKKRMLEYARGIQSKYKRFKSDLKKVDMEKSFYNI